MHCWLGAGQATHLPRAHRRQFRTVRGSKPDWGQEACTLLKAAQGRAPSRRPCGAGDREGACQMDTPRVLTP